MDSSTYPLCVREWLDRGLAWFFRLLAMDRGVRFLLSARLFQIAAYPVSVALIATGLTPEIQGFHYTFAGVLALQSIVELGLAIVITNLASHEWAHLDLDQRGSVVGSPEAVSRLTSLARLAARWYGVAGAFFVVGVGSVGWLFFARRPAAGVSWHAPWIAMVSLNGLLLWILPFKALLEGCNQVAAVNRLRLSAAVLESFAFWSLLLLGGGLWAGAAALGARVLREVYFLLFEYRRFIGPLLRRPTNGTMHWRSEIWPMQWRLALQGLVTYVASSLFNPVMFEYYGPVVAGRMGMTLQLANGLQLIGMAWISTNVPRFGVLVARREYAALDRLWLRVSSISVAVTATGAAAACGVIFWMEASSSPLVTRLLPPTPTALLLSAAVLLQCAQCLVAYLRAHRREAVLAPGIVMSLASGFLVWSLGSRFGPTGACAGYLIQMIVNVLWIAGIWRQRRLAWHMQ